MLLRAVDSANENENQLQTAKGFNLWLPTLCFDMIKFDQDVSKSNLKSGWSMSRCLVSGKSSREV